MTRIPTKIKAFFFILSITVFLTLFYHYWSYFRSPVLIIIPVLGNERENLDECLASLKESAYPLKVVTVKPKTGEKWTVSQLLNNVDVSGYRYMGILPQDCKIDKFWLHSMLRHGSAIVGSKVLDKEGRVLHAGIEFHLGAFPGKDTNMPLPFLRYRGYIHLPHEVRHVTAVSKWGLVMETRTWMSLNMFDESLATAKSMDSIAEDIDLCMRFDGRVVYDSSAVVHRTVQSVYETPVMTHEYSSIGIWPLFFNRWGDELILEITNKYVTKKLGVLWYGLFSMPSGFGNEAINYVIGLECYVPLKIEDVASVEEAGLEPCVTESLVRMRDKHLDIRRSIYISLWTPEYYNKPAGAAYGVGRHMFETDRVPKKWIPHLRKMDQVWVPTAFNYDTFHKSGIDSLVVVPQCIDTVLYNPESPKLLTLVPFPKPKFTFLSIFEWTDRKDWKTLVRAFTEEFQHQNDVVLVIRSARPMHHVDDDSMAIEKFIKDYVETELHQKMPRIVVIGMAYPRTLVPALYRDADCFVLASHGEAWGRPYMEAMSSGLPVIATGWGGHVEYIHEILVDYTITPADTHDVDYNGHMWAQASVGGLRQNMRWAVENPRALRAIGRRSRAIIESRYNLDVVARQVALRFVDIEKKLSSFWTPEQTRMSIVIAYREQKMLFECIHGLVGLQKNDIEVIAVPQSAAAVVSTQETANIRKKIIFRNLAAIPHIESQKLQDAFKRGIHVAYGDVIVMLSADLTLQKWDLDAIQNTVYTTDMVLGAMLLDKHGLVSSIGLDDDYEPIGRGSAVWQHDEECKYVKAVDIRAMAIKKHSNPKNRSHMVCPAMFTMNSK